MGPMSKLILLDRTCLPVFGFKVLRLVLKHIFQHFEIFMGSENLIYLIYTFCWPSGFCVIFFDL